MLEGTERERAVKALSTIVKAIIDTVNETPTGAPNGIVYAALMNVLTLQQYERIIYQLVALGKIKKSGDLLLPA